MMSSLIDELEREKAHSGHMSAMAQYWMGKAREAQRTLAIVVNAAGGKVIVHTADVSDAPGLELIRLEQAHDMMTHFIARKSIPHQPDLGRG